MGPVHGLGYIVQGLGFWVPRFLGRRGHRGPKVLRVGPMFT